MEVKESHADYEIATKNPIDFEPMNQSYLGRIRISERFRGGLLNQNML